MGTTPGPQKHSCQGLQVEGGRCWSWLPPGASLRLGTGLLQTPGLGAISEFRGVIVTTPAA